MNRKSILAVIMITSAASVAAFLYFLFKVMMFMKHPMDFSFLPIFYLMGTVIALFINALLYVHFMDMNVKKYKIEDVEDWKQKWDWDFKS